MRRPPPGLYPGEFFGSIGVEPVSQRDIRYKATGEYRAPKKGEYYLSGASINAYRAPNDLSQEFWIAMPGRVTRVTTETWEPLTLRLSHCGDCQSRNTGRDIDCTCRVPV